MAEHCSIIKRKVQQTCMQYCRVVKKSIFTRDIHNYAVFCILLPFAFLRSMKRSLTVFGGRRGILAGVSSAAAVLAAAEMYERVDDEG